MPMPISSVPEKRSGTSLKVRSASPRYIVTAVNDHWNCAHEFVDLDAGMAKIRELLVLGDIAVSVHMCKAPGN